HVEALRAHLADPAFLARRIGAAARDNGIAFAAQSVANRRTDAAHSAGYIRNSRLLGRHDAPRNWLSLQDVFSRRIAENVVTFRWIATPRRRPLLPTGMCRAPFLPPRPP